MMRLYQPALGEGLDSFEDGERLLLHGLANVGNCDGYYLITDRGVRYCDSEKTGLFKKTYVGRFFPKSRMARAIIDQAGPPQYAYLRIFDEDDNMALVIWVQDEFSETPALHQAEMAAKALGAE